MDRNAGESKCSMLPGILGRMMGKHFIVSLQVFGKDVSIQEDLGHQTSEDGLPWRRLSS